MGEWRGIGGGKRAGKRFLEEVERREGLANEIGEFGGLMDKRESAAVVN